MNDIVIIIDCWETWWSKFKIPFDYDYILFNKIKKFVESSDNIKTIILASYESIDVPTTIWHTNSLKFLGKDLYDRKDLLKNVDPDKYRRTDKIILNWVSDKQQIAMHYVWEFEMFIENNKIDNIYLCGEAMDMCVRYRPLGYESLSNIIRKHNLNSRIFLKDDCVNDSKGKIFKLEDYPGWIPTNKPNIFELQRNGPW